MLRNKFKNDLINAMKAKDTIKVSTLRLILAAIKDRDLESRGKGAGDIISDSTILEILAKMVKQRTETVKIYENAGRKELADIEKKEINIINDFMPKMLTKTEVEKVIEEAIKFIDAKSLRDLGKVISKIKEDYSGRCDFADVSQMIRKRLEG
ncbi:MAG TPA: GatB/YqeY domain-containing protein [Alphaproteobacteria bacterium]|nr:GatB/YqeY domain-containing protein [Alphaproteobacteria bacterium]